MVGLERENRRSANNLKILGPKTKGLNSCMVILPKIPAQFQCPIPFLRMMAASAPGSRTREGTAKAMVADQISQAVQSTSNLLHLMQQSSPAQAQLIKLPKNLLAKAPIIKNTEQVLDQMPGVISNLDAHMENGLRSVPHLKTVIQLLSNMESCQLNPLSQAHPPQKEREPTNQP